jgi:hypothetical protein
MRKSFIRNNMQKASAPKLNDETRSKLIADHFMEDIHLTEKLTGRDLSVWYK